MDTFIVRIYRRVNGSPQAPAGTVECVGCGELVGFSGRDQLWDRLFIGGRHAHESTPSGAASDSTETG